jgi:hypothetical protein
MTEKVIEGLLSPAAYPHPTAAIRLLETHISWVLLTGEFAYKIKKPVDFGFLDFSTLAKRKHYCEEELRLNSRFSTGLYLAVVAITGSEDAPLVDSAAEGQGAVLEYAVKMRQFDQDALLEKLADMKSLAKKLADFHQHAAARLAADDRELGTVESIAFATLENFRQIAPALTSEAARAELEGLRQWSAQQLAALQEVFAQRRAQGFVRECHGDLHLRNIARIDGAITFFDCIEFNPQLRWIDVQSELAFLLMDMDEKRLQALSNRLLNVYLEYSGDYQGLAVLQFYEVYRAMVRAKVMVLKVAGGNLARAEAGKVWQEYATYIRLAQSWCQPRQAFLGLMHGISGTGKSTIAATLASEFNAIRIRSDIERKRLFGLAPEARTGDAEKEQLYGEAASLRTFAALETLADTLLGFGYPVLVDATFIAEKWRRPFLQLAKRRQLPGVIIDCQASQATILQRLALRESRQHGASDAGIDVMRSQLAKLEPFSAEEQPLVLGIDSERPVDVVALKEYLERSRQG